MDGQGDAREQGGILSKEEERELMEKLETQVGIQPQDVGLRVQAMRLLRSPITGDV